MEDDLDLRNFSNVCRLFPLPGVVLFPHAILPLHVFEPRYRQMTEDALAGDKLVTIVRLRPTEPVPSVHPGALGSPPIEGVACLGRIIQHERLPDGRFGFLLLGRKRVRLRRELPTDKLYRIAEAEILEVETEDGPDDPRRSELLALFRRAFQQQNKLDPDLAAVLQDDLPLDVLTDIVAHALGLPAEMKQRLLAETRVGRRADSLLKILRKLVDLAVGSSSETRAFPPPFSAN